MELRDKIITGSFMIGADGRKEPVNWKDYALKLETLLLESRQGEYNSDWSEVINKVENDNSNPLEFSYSDTIKSLQSKFLIIRI